MSVTEQVPRLEVVELSTGDVVYVIPLRSADERHVDIVKSGMLINMDTERFCVREVLT